MTDTRRRTRCGHCRRPIIVHPDQADNAEVWCDACCGIDSAALTRAAVRSLRMRQGAVS